MLALTLLALVLLLLAAATLYGLGGRRLAGVLGAIVAGPVLYFLVGVAVPRFIGQGRFYSFPFGGLAVGDRELVLSVAAWVVACWVLLRAVQLRGRR